MNRVDDHTNSAIFNLFDNQVIFDKHGNYVDISYFRVESDYYYLNHAYLADFPKEREK